jgi:hypothetical protein
MDASPHLSKKRGLESPVAPPTASAQTPWNDFDRVQMDVGSPSFVDQRSTSTAGDPGHQLAHKEDLGGNTDSTAPFWCFGMVVSSKA